MNENRALSLVISTRLAEKAPLIQVIVGPRQVGKTTALKAALPKGALYESADYPTPLPASCIEDWWDQALKEKCKVLAIDEIQKISGWTEVLKKRWDQKPYQLKVVVTGSSALLVEKGLKETMAGRFELIRAEHWNCREAKEVFALPLKQFIEFGCYPGAIPLLKKDVNRWGQYVRDSIVEPALGRDLLQLHPVDQPALLRQVFGVAVSLPCQIVSLQKLQGQLQGKGTLPTLQHYLKLLSDAFLVSGIEKYSPALIRSKKSPPKLVIHDNALVRAFERPMEQNMTAQKFGHYFENSVGARFIEAGWETYYWKDRDLEVDFVVIGPNNEKWAVEVKTAKTNAGQLKGLFKFCQLYKNFEPVLVSLVDQKLENVKSVSAADVLEFSRKY